MIRQISILSLVLYQFLIGGFTSQKLAAQNVKEDLRKVNEAYEKFPELSMDVIYNAYDSYESTKAVDTYRGEMKRKGNMYFTRILDIENIYTENYAFMIDRKAQKLVAANPVPFKKSNFTMVDIDESMEAYSEVKTKIETKAHKVYYFKIRRNIVSEVEAFDLYINKQTNLVEKVVLYYAEAMKVNQSDDKTKAKKPRLEITFANINPNPQIDAALFNDNTYVAGKGKELKASEKYKNYTFINQVFSLK